jgi:hypothetical protein
MSKEELIQFLKENLTVTIWADNECSDTLTEVNVAINLGDETISTSYAYV